MAKVLVGHSFFLRFDAKAWKQMQPYPPLGTLYAANVLRNRGHEVAFYDAMLEHDEGSFRAALRRHRPEIVVLYEDSFNYLSKMCLSKMRAACLRMAEMAKEQGCFVIAHGSDPADHMETYFAGHIDVVIRGEGEYTAAELVDALSSVDASLRTVENLKEAFNAVAGIAFLENGRVHHTAPRSLIRNLDELPFPAWDLADIEGYRTAWKEKYGYFSLNMVTTRGCPYHCNWCAKPVYGQVYHSRSPENTAMELEYLKHAFKPDHIWFSDDILGLKPGWLKRYSECVEKRDIRTPFTCQTRVDLMLRENNVENMAAAGAHTVWVGAESGSQAVLDAMDKGTTIEQIEEATHKLQTHGMRVAWFLQFGYLGESEEDIDATLAMLRRIKPNDIGISVSYPMPGTGFYERVQYLLGEKQNWTESGDLDLMYPGTFHPDFYRALHKAVHHEFRFREGTRALASLRIRSLRQLLSIPYHLLSWAARRIQTEYLKRFRPSPVIAYPPQLQNA